MKVLVRFFALGLLLVAGLGLSATAALASTFNGVVFSKPLSPPFITSPAAYNVGQTLVFSVTVKNTNKGSMTIPLDFHANRILTFKGQNVADGQPGQAGITFGPNDYKLTTQTPYGSEQDQTLTIEGGATTTVTFDLQMTICGYFQIDLSTPPTEGNDQINLSAGFARVLGCTSPSPTPGGGGGGTGGTGGTGGVSGSTAATGGTGAVLATTGLPILGGIGGAVMVLLGAIGLRIKRQ
jgi:hypothetical protein